MHNSADKSKFKSSQLLKIQFNFNLFKFCFCKSFFVLQFGLTLASRFGYGRQESVKVWLRL